MRRSTYFAHLVTASRAPQELITKQDLHALKQEYRATNAVDVITQSLRARLQKRHEREKLSVELLRLERELAILDEKHHPKIAALQQKIKELQKNIRLTGL